MLRELGLTRPQLEDGLPQGGRRRCPSKQGYSGADLWGVRPYRSRATCRDRSFCRCRNFKHGYVQIVGRDAHNQDVDLQVEAALVVLDRGDLREARTIAQQAAGISALLVGAGGSRLASNR